MGNIKKRRDFNHCYGYFAIAKPIMSCRDKVMLNQDDYKTYLLDDGTIAVFI